MDIQLSPNDAKALGPTLLSVLPNTVLIDDVQALVDREQVRSRLGAWIRGGFIHISLNINVHTLLRHTHAKTLT